MVGLLLRRAGCATPRPLLLAGKVFGSGEVLSVSSAGTGASSSFMWRWGEPIEGVQKGITLLLYLLVQEVLPEQISFWYCVFWKSQAVLRSFLISFLLMLPFPIACIRLLLLGDISQKFSTFP